MAIRVRENIITERPAPEPVEESVIETQRPPIRVAPPESIKVMDLDSLQEYEEPKQFNDVINSVPEQTIDYADFGEGDDFDLRTDAEIAGEEQLKIDFEEEALESVETGDTGLEVTEPQAKTYHLSEVKRMENPGEKGLFKGPEGDVFMPFKSIEGQGPNKSMSEFEIGYGIKIPKKWLGNNVKDWPVVEGVSVDISKGVTRDQANAMAKDILDLSYEQSSKKLNGFDKLSEKEKSFWADLTYNGGRAAIDKNPKAKRTFNKAKKPVEAMVLALNYIKVNKKPSRGLLNRRLTMYNQAALGMTGVPIIKNYIFGKEIKIKFSNGFMTDKVSKAFSKKVELNDGWLTISKGGDKEVAMQADENFKFER